ncbi:hypothetical protein [Tenacibaculum sp. 190524A05c]|uniref:hypothetical protein n=1 Tax=Tenacibaculum platacis TaxID=3137852 RepID=UPI0032B0FD4C
MKFHKVLTIGLFYFSVAFISCRAQEQKSHKKCQNTEVTKELIKQELITQKEQLNTVIHQNVLKKTISNESFELFLKSEGLSMMSKIEIKSKKDIIDFTKFFDSNDFEYMRCQLKQNEIDNWKQLIEKDYFKTNNSNNKRLSYSIPLFSVNQNYALIYRETIASGNLFLLKRTNGKWEYFAKQLVWID